MEYRKIKCYVKSFVGYIELSNEKTLNAIDEGMATEILNALDFLDEASNVRLIIISSKCRAFSSGGDINYFYNKQKSGEKVELTKLANLVGQLVLKQKKCSKIIITVVVGVAAGAGANFAFAGDFVIAAKGSKFIESFVNVGLVPDTGGIFILTKSFSPQQIMKYCVLGEPIDAESALNMGLIYEVVEPEDISKAVDKLVKKLVVGPMISYKNIKKQVYEASFRGYEAYLNEVEVVTQNECASSHDFKEGVCAFVEKRNTQFIGE